MSRWFLSFGFAEVYDGLTIGAYPVDIADVEVLSSLSITQVLNLTQDTEYAPGKHEPVRAALEAAGIEEWRMELVDHGDLPPDALEEAVIAVLGWLEQTNGSVYVHCRAGRQRSAAIAAGVVAIREGVTINEALAFVKRRKPTADPLPHQVDDLHAWWDGRG
jgi:protein-tyrosine phosphatase